MLETIQSHFRSSKHYNFVWNAQEMYFTHSKTFRLRLLCVFCVAGILPRQCEKLVKALKWKNKRRWTGEMNCNDANKQSTNTKCFEKCFEIELANQFSFRSTNAFYSNFEMIRLHLRLRCDRNEINFPAVHWPMAKSISHWTRAQKCLSTNVCIIKWCACILAWGFLIFSMISRRFNFTLTDTKINTKQRKWHCLINRICTLKSICLRALLSLAMSECLPIRFCRKRELSMCRQAR